MQIRKRGFLRFCVGMLIAASFSPSIFFPSILAMAQDTPPATKDPNAALIEAFNAGRKALAEKDYDNAVAYFLKASELGPTQAAVWTQLAETYAQMASQESRQAEKQALFGKSAEAYRTALHLKPNKPGYWGNYAISAGKAGQIAEARDATEKAAKLDPASSGRYYFNLGAMLANAAQYSEAIAAFQMVPEGAPQFAKAQEEAGEIRKKYIFQSIRGELQNPAFASTLNTYVKSSGAQFQDLRGKEMGRVDDNIVWAAKLSLPGAQVCGILKDSRQAQLSCTLNTSRDKDQLRADYQQLVALVRKTLPAAWTFYNLDPEPDTGLSCRFGSARTEVWVSVNRKQSSYELDLSVIAYPAHAAGH